MKLLISTLIIYVICGLTEKIAGFCAHCFFIQINPLNIVRIDNNNICVLCVLRLLCYRLLFATQILIHICFFGLIACTAGSIRQKCYNLWPIIKKDRYISPRSIVLFRQYIKPTLNYWRHFWRTLLLTYV